MINCLVFVEDDELDYEFNEAVLKELYPKLNISREAVVDKNFYSKYIPQETLVMLDLNLAGIDGIDIFRESLAPSGYQTYIYTSSDNPADITRAKINGVPGYFRKAIGRENIKNQFRAILSFNEFNLIKA